MPPSDIIQFQDPDPELQELFMQVKPLLNFAPQLPFAGILLLQRLHGKDLEAFVSSLPPNILQNADPFLMDYKTNVIDLSQILSKSIHDLKFLLKRGFPFKKINFTIPSTLLLEPKKQKWILKHCGGKVELVSRLTLADLEGHQKAGWLPCFPEIPKILNYIWLVDRARSKDLLDGKYKDAYLENIKHNAKVLSGYEQILWTNCKECIPVTTKELTNLGFAIKELHELPHFDDPMIARVASIISTEYRKEVAPNFIDTVKVLIPGFVADLNYRFGRKPTERQFFGSAPSVCKAAAGASDNCDPQTLQNITTIAELDAGIIFSLDANQVYEPILSGTGPEVDIDMYASYDMPPFMPAFIELFYKTIYGEENFAFIINRRGVACWNLFKVLDGHHPYVPLHLGVDNVVAGENKTYY